MDLLYLPTFWWSVSITLFIIIIFIAFLIHSFIEWIKLVKTMTKEERKEKRIEFEQNKKAYKQRKKRFK